MVLWCDCVSPSRLSLSSASSSRHLERHGLHSGASRSILLGHGVFLPFSKDFHLSSKSASCGLLLSRRDGSSVKDEKDKRYILWLIITRTATSEFPNTRFQIRLRKCPEMTLSCGMSSKKSRPLSSSTAPSLRISAGNRSSRNAET